MTTYESFPRRDEFNMSISDYLPTYKIGSVIRFPALVDYNRHVMTGQIMNIEWIVGDSEYEYCVLLLKHGQTYVDNKNYDDHDKMMVMESEIYDANPDIDAMCVI